MKGFFKAATVASAAAALSLALGGGVAEAQGVEGPPSAPETTPVVNVLSIDSHTTTHSLIFLRRISRPCRRSRLVMFSTFWRNPST